MISRLASYNWLRFAALCFVLMLVLHGCQGCPKLKTIELQATKFATGTSGFAGSKGVCFSAGHPPPSPFKPGPGQILVGFDDFYDPGSGWFPCDDIRAALFHGGILFDVTQFDQIVAAELLIDTGQSISRTGGGETIGTIPPKSFATTLGVASGPFTSLMFTDSEVSLTQGPPIDVAVNDQVKAWVSKAHPNFGFVIGGPRGFVSRSSPPQDNDAQITLYRNFRLRITYVPAQNPRAPQ